MSQENAKSIIDVSRLHEQRLLQALSVVEEMFPLTADKIINIDQAQLFALETLTSRFGRLQDLMGSKLFDLCLLSLGENVDGLSMIDKANKLEKSSILDNSHSWMDMRRLRNIITHEYPDQPEITADILNKLHATIQPMLQLYNKMIATIENSQKK